MARSFHDNRVGAPLSPNVKAHRRSVRAQSIHTIGRLTYQAGLRRRVVWFCLARAKGMVGCERCVHQSFGVGNEHRRSDVTRGTPVDCERSFDMYFSRVAVS